MKKTKNVFIIGAKGLGNYGGYETFLDKLTEYHQNDSRIKYHVACKLNGSGAMDERRLEGVERISESEFVYHNAHCFKLKSPDLGGAQAILYDIKALQYCCQYIKNNQIDDFVVYILSSRVGPVMRYFAKKIHNLGGQYWNNPDGRENLRQKYNLMVRKYWKLSEKLMVKYSDLVVCDSLHIEKYIKEEYKTYRPKTTFIAYGADVRPSMLADNDCRYMDWLTKYNISSGKYYLSVGRFVPENNFETMVKEFMSSDTEKDYVIISNSNTKLMNELESKYHFSSDQRIKFVGTVYDQELLKKIRENAYGYIHGHSVGGTNPSLLEALSSTKLNLLLNVGFNQEVAEDAARYWGKEKGSLSKLINEVDMLSLEAIETYGMKSKQRIMSEYSWKYIADKYAEAFCNI